MSKKDKLKEELAVIKAAEKKKREKYYKYKKAGCSECKWVGHIWRDAGMGFNNKYRCDCTYTNTKRYQKALDATHLSVDKYNKKLSKFIDNNSSHNNSIWDLDRSW